MAPNKRSKGSFASLSTEPSTNVIDLQTYRKAQAYARGATKTLYHLTNEVPWLDLPQATADLRSLAIVTESAMKKSLLVTPPDLVLIDANLAWHNSIAVAGHYYDTFQIPIVMLCDPANYSQRFLKQAYAAGVHDTLLTPISSEELHQTLTVLLRLQRRKNTQYF